MLIDVQEKLFPLIDNGCGIIEKMIQAIDAFTIMGIPFIITEQYPKGLGKTLGVLQNKLPANSGYFSKTTFSAMKNKIIRDHIQSIKCDHWILLGIEAHVCVLQSTIDLLKIGKQVTILNDATGSRSIYDYSSAIAELRDHHVRVASTETIIYELVGDSSSPFFKPINSLIKCYTEKNTSCCCS